jgi:RsmE family RNA methyltransferase
MNLILLFPNDFIDGSNRVHLTGRRYQYIREVHRVQLGNQLCVGLVNGKVGTGTITSLTGERLEMDVTLDAPPPHAIPLTLIIALPRPNVLKRVLIAVSSLGIKKIIIVNSKRVEKSFWLSPVLKEEKIKEQLIWGLEQAKDTVMPEVLLRPLFKPFVEDELSSLARGTLALVAHPAATEECPKGGRQGPVTMMVGPEGGFIPYEIERFVELGIKPVRLGERVLRVETAVPAVIARLF